MRVSVCICVNGVCYVCVIHLSVLYCTVLCCAVLHCTNALLYPQIREFVTTWRDNIRKMNENVMLYFGNIRIGMEILKQVLMVTVLLACYSLFVYYVSFVCLLTL